MNLVGLKPVDQATAQWAMAAFRASSAVPVDVCGPVAIVGADPPRKRWKFRVIEADQRAKISASLRRFHCKRLGISETERRDYRRLVSSFGFSSKEALEIVLRGRKSAKAAAK
jgi:hypothetical protein